MRSFSPGVRGWVVISATTKNQTIDLQKKIERNELAIFVFSLCLRFPPFATSRKTAVLVIPTDEKTLTYNEKGILLVSIYSKPIADSDYASKRKVLPQTGPIPGKVAPHETVRT